MSVWRMLAVLGCVALIAVGQLLFKYAAGRVDPKAPWWMLAFEPYLILAGVIYVGATFLWVMQLKSVPLNRAYPLFALAFILVPLLSHFVFGERLNLAYLAGCVLIIAGTVLCTTYY
jgi:drug/metabolite transporter (DMT)-like permease